VRVPESTVTKGVRRRGGGLSILDRWARLPLRGAMVALLIGLAYLTVERAMVAVAVAVLPVVILTFAALTARWALAARASMSVLTSRQDTLDAARRAAALAFYLTVASTLVWRTRSANELSANPLDFAGMIRVGLLGVAGLVALTVLQRFPAKGLPTPFRRYWLYVYAVFFGIGFALQPLIVIFRVFELVSFMIVGLALWAVYRDGEVPLRMFFKAMAVLGVLVLIGVLTQPSAALVPMRGGIWPYRLEGVFPAQTANGVGTFGVLLFAYGLTRYRPAIVVGLAFVAATQYRTGYIAVLVVLGIYLLLKEGSVGKLLLISGLAFVPMLLTTPEVNEAWSRGESAEEVAGLNSRRQFWAQGGKVAERSPVLGTGLSSGTRFEALAQIGRDDTSTIHSTWVEAYVGTGVLGTAALGVAFASAVVGTVRLQRRTGDMLPLLILSVLAVRSITGTSIELAGLMLLAFILCALRSGDGAAMGGRQPGSGVAPSLSTAGGRAHKPKRVFP